jgi:hypothetical protein
VPTVRALAGVSNADATRYLKEWSEEKSVAGGQVAAAGEQLAQARAVEQEAGVTIQVVTANQTGPLATGYSLMVDPFGVVRARVPSLLNRRFTVAPPEPQPGRVKPEKA